MNDPDLLQALNGVVAAFHQLHAPYFITGSVAASFYGLSRTTIDIDIVARIHQQQAGPLARLLEEAYYIDEQAVCDAIAHHSSFNLIHLESMIKVDVFVSSGDAFSTASIERARKEEIGSTIVAVASAEDVILSKLDWFIRTGKTSRRQWSDIIEIIRLQAASLNSEYMKKWAASIGAASELDAAMAEAVCTE